VSDTFRQLAFPVLAEQIQIRFAKLGGDAGYVGAAGIARRDYFRSTSEG
jgi:glucokinase